MLHRAGQWLPVPPAHEANGKADPYEGARPSDQEEHRRMICRVRTIADMISTGMIESPAENIDDIISEVAAARVTERGTRATTKPARRLWRTERKRGIFRMSDAQQTIELLRFNTCGSVDDGKSTLIGRLLYDSKSIMEDQMEAFERSADITGGGQVNLANLTDGLRAEREQGITIDVAYRYVATPKRNLSWPTRRAMWSTRATWLLAQARQPVHRIGRRTQWRDRADAAAQLHLRFTGHSTHCVCGKQNGFGRLSEERFREIREGIEAFLPKLNLFKDVKFIPISALEGDNVVTFGQDTVVRGPYVARPYRVCTHCQRLESEWPAFPRAMGESPEQSDRSGVTRFPWPVRPDAGGIVKVGQEVLVLPSGQKSRIQEIWTYDGPLEEAFVRSP